jgi:hypothetical protein
VRLYGLEGNRDGFGSAIACHWLDASAVLWRVHVFQLDIVTSKAFVADEPNAGWKISIRHDVRAEDLRNAIRDSGTTHVTGPRRDHALVGLVAQTCP